MKRVLSMLLAACLCCGLLAGCGGDTGSEEKQEKKKEEKKEFIKEGQIAELFTNPDNFKGKYVVLTGKIFVEPEKEDGTTALQVWHDPQNAQYNFIVHYSGSESFSTNNYIKVDGRIEGAFKGENMMGGTVTVPLIKSDTIETMSYIEAVTPTIKEIAPENAISEQNGISLKVDKIEFAEKETRIYMTEANSSADKFSMFTYNMKIIQNGQQIEQDVASVSSFEGDYAQLSSDILPNASSSGILVFPAIDSSASFQIYAEGFSDNYELEFAPFTIDIAAQ